MRPSSWVILASVLMILACVPPASHAQGAKGRRGWRKGPMMAPGADLLGDLQQLNLSQVQRGQLQAIQRDAQQQIAELKPTAEGPGAGAEMQAKRQQIMRDSFDRSLAVLTAEQRADLADLSLKRLARPTGDMAKPLDVELLQQLGEAPQADAVQPPGVIAPFESAGEIAPLNGVDVPVLDALAKLGIEPAPLCSDEVFVRRVYLDVIGKLPTPREAFEFAANEGQDKRELLIDDLLRRDEFADYWAMRWGDVLRVKAEFPINLWPNGAAVYHRWIREAIRTGMPYDKFARELLTASGSNFRNPPTNFFRAVQEKDAFSLAEAAALTFMGSKMIYWPEERAQQMAVFFSRVGYKSTDEWKEEIVYWNRNPVDPATATLPDGTEITISPNVDPRQVLADWLVSPQNELFAQCGVNRVWFWLFGRGIIDGPDDFRPDNPPANSELLDYLVGEFTAADYDLRRLLRLILNSRTYQQSAIARSTHPQAEAQLAFYPMRPMDAEVLQDALCQILDTQVGYTSDVPEPFTFVPQRQSTVSLADGTITSTFLQTFGRPTRDTGLASDRSVDVTDQQRMYFINSTDMNRWIEESKALRVMPAVIGGDPTPSIRLLWLTMLSRLPTSPELAAARKAFESTDGIRIEVLQDLAWTLLNTKEFWCRH